MGVYARALVTAAARLGAVLVVTAGVLAMHTTSSGHQEDLSIPAGAGVSVTVPVCGEVCVHALPGGTPHEPGHLLLQTCLAVLLATASFLAARRARGDRAWLAAAVVLQWAPSGFPARGSPPRFALGVLRT